MEKELTKLREENERLKIENQSISDSAWYYNHISNGLQDKVTTLREENERLKEELKVTKHYLEHHQENSDRLINEVERLRANAIVWHKWPDEVPKNNGWRIVRFDISGAKYWDKAYFSAPNHWEHDGRYYDPHMWAEMPEGE
jgi:hypothetical protein